MTTSGQQPPELPSLGPSTTSKSGETTTSSDYSEKASNTAPAPGEDTNPPQQHGNTLPGNRDLPRTLKITPASRPPATSVSSSCHRTPHRQGKRWTGTATWIGSDRIALLTLVLVAAGVGLAGMGQHKAAIGNEKSDQSLDFTHYMGCLAHPVRESHSDVLQSRNGQLTHDVGDSWEHDKVQRTFRKDPSDFPDRFMEGRQRQGSRKALQPANGESISFAGNVDRRYTEKLMEGR